MADYTKPTGEGGQLLIRVTDTEIQFHIQAGYSSTFGTVNWSGRVNGQDVSGSAQYPSGGSLFQLGSWPRQGSDITFRIAATGTSGLGGPTELGISLASPPGAPSNFRVEERDATHIAVRYDQGPNNGANIDYDEATWFEIQPNGTDPVVIWVDTNAHGYTNTAGGPVLKPGRDYHVYVRSKNAAGFGPSVGFNAGYTHGAVLMKLAGVYRRALRYVKVNGVYRLTVPFVKNGGVYKPTK